VGPHTRSRNKKPVGHGRQVILYFLAMSWKVSRKTTGLSVRCCLFLPVMSFSAAMKMIA
jgi:hypothetical protein